MGSIRYRLGLKKSLMIIGAIVIAVVIIAGIKGTEANAEEVTEDTKVIIRSADTLDDGVVLKWDMVDGAVKYEISRSDKINGTYKVIGTTESVRNHKGNVYVDYGLTRGTYYYKVRAVLKDFRESLYFGKSSDPIKGTIRVSYSFDKNAMKNREVEVKSIEGNKLELTWDKVPGAKGYEIYRSKGYLGSFFKVGTVGNDTPDKVTFDDETAKYGSLYTYKVRFFMERDDATQYGEFSEPRSSNIAAVNEQIGDVYVSLSDANAVNISWDPVKNASQYVIYRSDGNEENYHEIIYVEDAANYEDKDLVCGRTYYYKVQPIEKIDGKDHYMDMSEAASITTINGISGLRGKINYEEHTVSLMWDAYKDAIRYEVYRGYPHTEPGFSARESLYLEGIAYPSDSMALDVEYVDTLTEGSEILYSVRAIFKINGREIAGPHSYVIKIEPIEFPTEPRPV